MKSLSASGPQAQEQDQAKEDAQEEGSAGAQSMREGIRQQQESELNPQNEHIEQCMQGLLRLVPVYSVVRR